ncbi:MAG TPA: hypothetical protein VIV12_15490 [Streptosporangiaceae bacterium]
MSDPFASAQDFSQYMGITLPTDLARMQMMLELASASIRRYCGQTLSPVDNDVVVLEPIERDTLVLPERPVTAVSSVLINTIPSVVTTNYRFTRAGLIHELSGLFWSSGATVTYNHGYAESTDEYKAIKGVCMAAASRAYTLNERSASEFLGSTLAESAGFSPEVFLTPGEKMQLADLGKVAVG